MRILYNVSSEMFLIIIKTVQAILMVYRSAFFTDHLYVLATAAVSATQRQSCAPPAVNEESSNTIPEIDKSSPTRRLTPITSKLDESRSKLLAMLSQLDKYKCGKVGPVIIR